MGEVRSAIALAELKDIVQAEKIPWDKDPSGDQVIKVSTHAKKKETLPAGQGFFYSKRYYIYSLLRKSPRCRTTFSSLYWR